jgi:hypothetical protein
VVAVNKYGGENFCSGVWFGKSVAAELAMSAVAQIRSNPIGDNGLPCGTAATGRMRQSTAPGRRAMRANPARRTVH